MTDMTEDIMRTATIFGCKVYRSRYVPEGEVLILGRGDEPEMPLPADWATMSEDDRRLARAKWALSHGGSLVMRED